MEQTYIGVRAPQSDDDLVGASVGSFRLVRRLGKGGMGTVYLAEHPVIGSKVAIKFLHPSFAQDPGLVQRFYDEARAVNLIGHENIVNIFDLNVLSDGRYYIVMEYLPGQTLGEQLGLRPPDPATSLRILIQLCDALHAAHQQEIIHRDVKPDNVFVLNKPGRDVLVKLVDFGIAKLRDENAGTESGVGLIIGTPEYMAPEQCTSGEIDARTDVYALGVIAYRLAAGRPPFEAQSVPALLMAHLQKAPLRPRTFCPGVSPEWEEAILKALEKEPLARFQTAAAFGEALTTALERLPLDAHSPSSAPRPRANRPRTQLSRLEVGFEVEVTVGGGGPVRKLSARDISRGGMFLCTPEPCPPLFTPLRVSVQTGPGQRLELGAEVVRHVSAREAQAWKMAAGFGIQFVNLGPLQKAALGELVARLGAKEAPVPAAPGPAPSDDQPQAARLLEYFRKRMAGNHYELLDLPLDADFGEVRNRARGLRAELGVQRAKRLSAEQLRQIDAVLARIDSAVAVLGEPSERLGYDAQRGNFLGVTHCILTGLSPLEIEAQHREYGEKRPEVFARVQEHLARAEVAESMDNPEAALAEYEAGLNVDPLNLFLHQRYWRLKGGLGDGHLRRGEV